MRRLTVSKGAGLVGLALSAGCASTAQPPAPAPEPAPVVRVEVQAPEAQANPFGVGIVPQDAPSPRVAPRRTPAPADAPRVVPAPAPTADVADAGYRAIVPGPEQVANTRGYDSLGFIHYVKEGPVDAEGNERSAIARVGVFGVNAGLDLMTAIPFVRKAVDQGNQPGSESYWDNVHGHNHDGSARKAPIAIADYAVGAVRVGTPIYHMAQGGRWLQWKVRSAYECPTEAECQRRQREE